MQLYNIPEIRQSKTEFTIMRKPLRITLHLCVQSHDTHARVQQGRRGGGEGALPLPKYRKKVFPGKFKA